MRRSEGIIGCLLLLAVLAGCKSRFQDTVEDGIERNCGVQPKAGCTINLKDVTGFKWDRMYIFGSWTTSDVIEKMIGFKYNGDGTYDATQRILFTGGNKVVFEEDINYLNGDMEILFDTSADSLFQSKRYYTPSEATFEMINDKKKPFSAFVLIRAKIRN